MSTEKQNDDNLKDGAGVADGGTPGDDAYEKTVISRPQSVPQNVPRTPERPPGANVRQVVKESAAPAKKEKVRPEDLRGAAKSKKNSTTDSPEDSIPLRLATVSMVSLLITSAAIYTGANWLIAFMLIWLAMIGTLLSYLFRVKRPVWINILPAVGACALLTYLFVDLAAQFNLGTLNLLASFTIILAGLQALHCFDLRTRADFSFSALVGLGLLVCTAGAANDLLFFVSILGYITCISLIFYFDGVSRSREVGPSRPIGEGRPASLPKPTRRQARAATSVIAIPVLSLPLLTICMFFCMPRSSSLITWLMENGIRPFVAVSQTERTKGYTPGAGTGATPSSKGSGGTAPGGTGGKGGSGGTGGAANPEKSLNPLDKRTSGKAPRGVGGSKGAGEGTPFKEGTTKNDQPQQEAKDVLPPAEPTDEVVLRISTPRPGYLRRMAFDTYDGESWSRQYPIKEVEFEMQDSEFPVGNANAFIVPKDCPMVEVTQEITADMPLSGGALPAMWMPQQVAGPFDMIAVQMDGTLRPDSKIEAGTSYYVKSYVPIYRLDILQNLPLKTKSDFKASLLLPPVAEMEAAEKELIDRYLQLPDGLPKRVRDKAKKVAGKDGNWFVKAQRISEYLHGKRHKYKNSNVYRVKGGDFVDNFLFRTREGNCVDFASAFVIMARSAGVPARLVAGYLPGKFNQRTGFQEVKVKDGHAWAEIYMPNWSWIPFDPAPNGSLPEVQKDEGIFSKLASLGLANPFGGAFNRGTPGGGIGHGITGSKMQKDLVDAKRKKEGKPPVEEDEEDFNLIKRLSKFRWEPIAIAVILISSAVVSFVILQHQRRKHVLVLPEDARKSTLLFFQVVRDLRKYKIVRLQTDTPLDLAHRIKEGFELHRQEGKFVHPELEPLLGNFIEIYTLDRFGRSEDRVRELEEMSQKIRKLVSAGK